MSPGLFVFSDCACATERPSKIAAKLPIDLVTILPSHFVHFADALSLRRWNPSAGTFSSPARGCQCHADGVAAGVGRSALERADCPICGAQPLHHHVQCESEQRLAECWILQNNLAVDVQRKHVECTCDLGSDRGATGAAGHQAHFSDRNENPASSSGMRAEAAHAHARNMPTV